MAAKEPGKAGLTTGTGGLLKDGTSRSVNEDLMCPSQRISSMYRTGVNGALMSETGQNGRNTR